MPRSGDGNGFATRYAEDFALYAEHGLTHHRLSLEWTRLEPVQGQHDRRRGRALPRAAAGRAGRRHLDLGLPPPLLAARAGSPTTSTASATTSRAGCVWSRHVDWVAETFGDLVAGWKPINEPTLLRPRLAPARRHPAGPQRPQRGRQRARHDPPGRRRRRPPAAHARPRRWPPSQASSRSSRSRTPPRRRRRRRGSTSSGGSRGPTTTSSTPTTTSASPTTRPSASRGDGSIGPWPVDGTPGPQGYVRVGGGLRPRARAPRPRTTPADGSSCARRASAPTTTSSARTTSRTSSATCTTPSRGGIDVRRPVLVDRRRQLRVEPGLRRALRPLRPRPQPQPRRRGREAPPQLTVCARIVRYRT